MDTKSSSIEKLTVSGLFRFLLFDAQAIRAVAASNKTFWLGLLFVLAAGFAREYDGEYLLAEPWHLVLPLVASLVGCFAMVVLIFVFLKVQKAEEATFLETLRSFLNVYWMTAPMALLYGIPFERMFDPYGATRANLWLLAFVAAWRVLLMIRCTQVLCGTSPLRSIFPVMFFSVALALLALLLVPGPLFMVMGGVRLSESESLIGDIRLLIGLVGYLTMPLWVIGYLVILFRRRPLQFYRADPNWKRTNPQVAVSLWQMATVSTLMWIPALMVTQPEQALRYQAESLIKSGDFTALKKLTSEMPASRFPPHWDPPPRVGYGKTKPNPLDVLVGLGTNDNNSWLVDIYAHKLAFRVGLTQPQLMDSTMSDERVEKLISMLEKLPKGKEVALDLCEWQWEKAVEVSTKRQRLIKRLYKLAGVGIEEPLDILTSDNYDSDRLVEIYSDKLMYRIRVTQPQLMDGTLSDERVEQLVAVLEKLPKGKQIANKLCKQQSDEAVEVSAKRQALIDRLLKLAGIEEGNVEDDGNGSFPLN